MFSANPNADELKDYPAVPVVSTPLDPIVHWSAHLQDVSRLAQYALDYLSIPGLCWMYLN
jgi:hypothetical protein